MSSEYPLEIFDIDEELNVRLLHDFTGERTGFVQVGPDKWFLPRKYKDQAANFYNLQVRPDDTWVVTYPRSGTTWTQEMVWLIANNLDYETARRIPQTERFPFFEFSLFVHDEIKSELLKLNAGNPEKLKLVEQISRPGYEVLNEMKSPRFIKTHLPFSLLPPNLLDVGCKVVYVARNPKDVAVSFYHLNRLIRTQGYLGDFPRYWDYFENNLHPWAPYWSHVTEGWDHRHNPSVLFLFYEEMNKNLPATINKVAKFLERGPLNDEQVSSLVNYLNIKNFRNNPAVNFDLHRQIGLLNEGEEEFIRKGKNGSWKDEFTPELSRRADQWIQRNLEHTDLRFP
ncbi:sulfotransferase 1C4 [Zootermopsis nevadensis]|uniref:Sulfotransferase 1C4 n=1 Tax=Zootermopsis nevadensis TaxID=136037 RepID=A0A067QQ48_ZOONE|nr:sulfotransferase 1C4 [Zootermopsis nevadensis]XP_021933866.1 sulfotransferase 1C4 [Zootermopsis nevadensis]KDR11875.1 Sulfotransferase 1C4 [Zootermopsis nevadensis]